MMPPTVESRSTSPSYRTSLSKPAIDMRSRVNRSRCRCPQWDLLTDDIWRHIIEHVDSIADKLAMQKPCRRFYQLLANPSTPSTWAELEMCPQRAGLVWLVCEWVQRRLKGISAICFRYRVGDSQQRMLWQALVASTAGTDIRLKVIGTEYRPDASAVLMMTASRGELVQRLTAASITVSHAADIAAVHGLAALRHLQIACTASTSMQWSDASHTGGEAVDCQLHRLCTLQLHRVPPAAFFLPGTAGVLQQLHFLHLCRGTLPHSVLPAEMLRLQSVSRLELLQLPLRMMPDLRRLPALLALTMSGRDGEPRLGASQAGANHAELAAALKINPLGGAMGLTEVILHGIPVVRQECAEAIERLPHLELLALDYLTCEEGAFWAATLQRRMRGRCRVELASDHLSINDNGEAFLPQDTWPGDNDW